MGVSRRRAGRVGRASVSKAAGKDDARWDRNARVVQAGQDLGDTLGRDRNGQFNVLLDPASSVGGGQPRRASRPSPLVDHSGGTTLGNTLHAVEEIPAVYSVAAHNAILSALRNNIATLAQQNEKLIAALQQAGLME
jgi:hypothetical protein